MSNQIIKNKRNKKITLFLINSTARKNLIYGSAGSSKSWSVAQHLLLDKHIKQPKARSLITRTTGPALKKSCWLLMTDLLNTYEIKHKMNLSDLTITLFNGSQMYFVPLDDINKLKSIERINYVWAEEATQLSKDEYIQLDLRCRGDNPYGVNQLYFTFNPDDENSFLKPLCENPPENTAVNHSTYRDNAFNSKEYINTIEQLQLQDWTYWLIYGLGVWATPTGMIYSNWDIVKGHTWPSHFDDIGYGIDFGYNNPSVLLESGIYDQEIYLREIIYETNLTNQDFINRVRNTGINPKSVIYADSAEPDRIMEFSRSGYNIYNAQKGPNSVADGIDIVKRYKLHIHEDSVNIIKEIKGYKWRIDRAGNVIDGEPVKFNDHAMDAMRYYIFSSDKLHKRHNIKKGKVYV